LVSYRLRLDASRERPTVKTFSAPRPDRGPGEPNGEPKGSQRRQLPGHRRPQSALAL